jgi:membrane-associated phospholipid phosphatase
VRQRVALREKLLPLAQHVSNGDEQQYSSYAGNYSKGLPHDAVGGVERGAYEALLRAVASGDPDDFAAVPMAGVLKQVNPQSAFAFELMGPDAHQPDLRAAPGVASAEAAAELAEVYWMALLRDVPFEEYTSHPAAAAAALSLSTFSDFRAPREDGRITPGTLFRGSTPGELEGPYLSQFLYSEVPFGPFKISQRVKIAEPSRDYLTDYDTWLEIQNGAAPAPAQYGADTRYIVNGRDLSEYVHRDFSYQAFLNAGLVLMASAPLTPTNPYWGSAYANQGSFSTFGGPQMLDLVAHAANLALRAAWCHKWLVHRRLRPEAMAGLVHTNKTAGTRFPVHDEIMRSALVEAVRDRTGSYLLPMAYAEGSPAHPSYPAGHAAIAGACATLLKALFDETAIVAAPVVPDGDGQALVPYAGPALTVGGELNKLAGNIAFGRNHAGVHYRSDGAEGMHLGEAIGMGMLRDVRECFIEPFDGFQFTSFSGQVVTI